MKEHILKMIDKIMEEAKEDGLFMTPERAEQIAIFRFNHECQAHVEGRN